MKRFLITLVISASVLVALAAAGIEVGAGAAGAPGSVTARQSRYGTILTDGNGRALYLFTHDRAASSTCYGACATAWPPLSLHSRLRAGPGIRRRLLATTLRRDGSRQITYNGHPLYYYVNDRAPGQVGCQNVRQFGGTWLVVNPAGAAIH